MQIAGVTYIFDMITSNEPASRLRPGRNLLEIMKSISLDLSLKFYKCSLLNYWFNSLTNAGFQACPNLLFAAEKLMSLQTASWNLCRIKPSLIQEYILHAMTFKSVLHQGYEEAQHKSVKGRGKQYNCR